MLGIDSLPNIVENIFIYCCMTFEVKSFLFPPSSLHTSAVPPPPLFPVRCSNLLTMTAWLSFLSLSGFPLHTTERRVF